MKTRENTKKLAGYALLTALIIVLTFICTFTKFLPFPITLALTPIIVGGAIYGIGGGIYLGAVFGALTFVCGFLGDAATLLMIQTNFVYTLIICLAKAILAGFAASAVYKAVRKKNEFAAIICASVVCPVTNTLTFVLLMLLLFRDMIFSWAGGQSIIYYVVFGLCGTNFLIELFVNLVLSSAVTRIIKTVRSRM